LVDVDESTVPIHTRPHWSEATSSLNESSSMCRFVSVNWAAQNQLRRPPEAVEQPDGVATAVAAAVARIRRWLTRRMRAARPGSTLGPATLRMIE